MTVLEFLILLLVAGVAGAIGQALGGYSRGGCLISVGLGFIGALVGSWLAGILGLPVIFAISIGGTGFPIVWAILGAALFVAFVNLFAVRPL